MVLVCAVSVVSGNVIKVSTINGCVIFFIMFFDCVVVNYSVADSRCLR